MDIYLIRHTQTATPQGLCYGQLDVPLATSFQNELAQLRQKLPQLTAHCQVFSSPLSRCTQLAQQLSNAVNTDERLLELSFGDWEGVHFDALPADSLRNWTENFVNLAPPNGESFTELCQRVNSFWQTIITSDAQQVLLITHAGVIRALLAVILKLPFANAFQFRVDAGSVHKLHYLNQYTYIHFLNL